MATRVELRTMIRLRLGDIAATPVITDDQINQWIDDGIREYSMHFPRQAELHIVCSVGVREYVIEGRMDESGNTVNGAKSILRVEYPLGEQPPKILLRRCQQDRRGFLGGNVYDIRAAYPLTLVLGPSPDGAQTIGMQVTCDHPWLIQDSSATTLPDRHLELLILFVRLLALQELAATEAMDPSPTGVILTGLSTMLAKAKEDYQSKLDSFILGESPGGEIARWGG